MYILGISAFYHDSAAALIHEGNIIAAAQEERFTRIKFDKRFPLNAIRFCLNRSGIKLDEISAIVFFEKTERKIDRIVSDFLSFSPFNFKQFLYAMPEWLNGKFFLDEYILVTLKDQFKSNWNGQLLFSEHHQAHAASAFYPSPYKEAAILVLDAVGEWQSSSTHIGQGSMLWPLKEQHFPHSLGMVYSAFTNYLGFKVNSGEYKLMGLSPYGEAKYAQLIMDNLIDLKKDGSFRVNLEYFAYHKGLQMTNKRFHRLFGGVPRIPESAITQREMDIAASIQRVTEEIVLRMARNLAQETRQKNLCLAGGVALNCVANAEVLRSGLFENLWIQPAAGDAGGALGAALAGHYLHFESDRKISDKVDSMQNALLGPEFTDEECEEILIQEGAVYNKFTESQLCLNVIEDLASSKVVGWFQGRMEFGPRALGNRSIIGDPRDPEMQSKINLKIKFRESFRPFAPIVIEEKSSDYFEMREKSPYMVLVSKVKKERCKTVNPNQDILTGIDKLNLPRSDIPAVTHVDYSARVQTVSEKANPRFYNLLKQFESRTGYAVLVNTSFNVRGEPIVCNVRDAFRCFMGTDMDILVINNFYLTKWEQTLGKTTSHKATVALD